MANGILLACMHAYMVVPHHGYRLLAVHKFHYLFGRMCTCVRVCKYCYRFFNISSPVDHLFKAAHKMYTRKNFH